jgi:hypothetical protein
MKSLLSPKNILWISLVFFVACTILMFTCGREMVINGLMRNESIEYRIEKNKTTDSFNVPVKTEMEGQKGDSFGGAVNPLIAWLAALVTFAAFVAQYLANDLQKQQFEAQRKDTMVERFENRFFKFMDYHRENVNEMKYRKENQTWDNYWEGTQVFTRIHYEIRKILSEFIKNGNLDFTLLENKREAINFVYQFYFYGAGEDGMRVLESIFTDKRKVYFDWIQKEIKRTNTTFVGKFNGNQHKMVPKKEVYYSGHVRRLGHYFRNIHQAIQYVENQKELNEIEKYDYVRTFRAQMSVYEQLVFFYNSVSKLGESWEIAYHRYGSETAIKHKYYTKLLITKYDLIRNTIFNDVDGVVYTTKKLINGNEQIISISIKDFYPLICLEREEEYIIHGNLPFVDGRSICRCCFNELYIGYINKSYKETILEYFNDENINENKRMQQLNKFNCSEQNCKSMPIIEKLRSKYKIAKA